MPCTCRTQTCPHCDAVVYPGIPVVAHPVVSAIVFHKDEMELGEDDLRGLAGAQLQCPECGIPFWFAHERGCLEDNLSRVGVPHNRREGFLGRIFTRH